MITRAVLHIALAVAVALIGSWPPAFASTSTIGQTLPSSGTAGTINMTDGVPGPAQASIQQSSDGTPYTYQATANGYITEFRFEMTSYTSGLMRFFTARHESGLDYNVTAVTDEVTPAAGVKTFSGYCIPVQTGDYIGVSHNSQILASAPFASGGTMVLMLDSVSTTGSKPFAMGGPNLLPMNATLDTDPACAKSAAPDEAPAISDLTLSRDCLKKASGQAGCRKSSVLSVTVSASSTLTIDYQLRRAGVRKSDSPKTTCKAVSRKKRARLLGRKRSGREKYRRCTTYSSEATSTHSVASGPNTLTITATVGKTKLPEGTYKLAVLAKSSTGKTSSLKYVTLKVG